MRTNNIGSISININGMFIFLYHAGIDDINIVKSKKIMQKIQIEIICVIVLISIHNYLF
jgi:hypothetical protein